MVFQKKNTFRGGIHPRETLGGKALTGPMPVKDMEPPAQVAIPLSQHVGAPAKPVVKAGDTVNLGQVIGEAGGFVSAPVHSSVSGKVVGIQPRMGANGLPVQCVVIDNDFEDRWDESVSAFDGDPLREMSVADMKARIQAAGIVGLGGATFPTHVKLSPPAEKPIDTVILNGAECEPYLTGDHRAMLEDGERIADGLAICMKILGAPLGLVGIEDNKPDAIAKMTEAVARTREKYPLGEMRVEPLLAKYPQGGEKQLIHVLTGREVPSGKLPMDAKAVVVNVSSAAAISRAVREGRPVVWRTVTVTGMVKQPGNWRVRIGERVGRILEAAGGPLEGADKLILGGPMMGMAAYREDTPVTKGTSGILLLRDDTTSAEKMSNCIRCGTCVRTCPIHLMPLELYALSKRSLFERCREFHALDCIECGSCAYNCPARLPLVQAIRAAKRELTKKR